MWLFAGCVGDKGVAPATQPAGETLGPVVVSPRNAVMAIGESLTVHVAAMSLSGTPITTFDSVLYLLQNVTDTLRVRVTTNGQITALSPSGINNPVLLQVVVFKGGVARADLALIQVTETAIPGATLSIQPVPPDSAKIAWGDTKEIDPLIQNVTTGEAVVAPTVRYDYGPGDSLTLQCYAPTLAPVGRFTQAQLQLTDCGQNGNAGTVWYNQIHAFKKGTAWIHAYVWVYGAMQHDSVQYTISNPYDAPVQAGPSQFQASQPARSSVFIAPGGTIYFLNGFNAALGASVTFTLDNPSAALATDPPSPLGGTSGNITTLTPGQQATRKFVTPGVYHWTATVSGGVPPYTGATSTGTITVE